MESRFTCKGRLGKSFEMRSRKSQPKRTGPSSPQRSARWAAQREELLHAAQRAIRKHGEAVSMEDIAREAGITRPILYRHFGDRHGTAIALRDWMLEPFSASLPTLLYGQPGPAESHSVSERREDLIRGLNVFVSQFAAFIEANPELYRFLRSQGMFDDKWEAREGEWSDPISEGVGRVLLEIVGARSVEEHSARVWGYALIGMIGNPLEWWAATRRADRLDMERDVMHIVRACIDGLSSSVASRRRRASSGSSAKKSGRARG